MVARNITTNLYMRTAPWVDPVHSHVTYLQMAQYLPVKAFSVWHLIPQFFISTAVPTFAFSGAVVTKLSNSTFPGWGSTANEGTSVKAMNRRKRETDYGLSRDLQDELDTLIPKSMFEEDTVGANSEALLCLKKGGSSTWGKCEEYGLFVRELVDVERQRQGTLTSTEGRPRLKIRTYFAQTDAMIGVKGQSYVEECWRGLDGNEFIDVVDFASITVAGVDHDTLIQSVQTLEMIFAEVKGIWN